MTEKERALDIYRTMFDEIYYDSGVDKDYALEKTYYCSLNAIDICLDFVDPNCVDYVLGVRSELEKMFKFEIQL